MARHDEGKDEHRHASLRTYRARSLSEPGSHGLTATAVAICSDACSTAALFAALEPTFVVQLPRARDQLGAQKLVDVLRAAVTEGPIRTLIVCGHADCTLSLGCTEERVDAARQSLLAQCGALVEDATLGPMIRAGRLALQPLLFDEGAGDIFGIDPVSRRLVLMSDPQILEALGR
jgi:hypothetical protein